MFFPSLWKLFFLYSKRNTVAVSSLILRLYFSCTFFKNLPDKWLFLRICFKRSFSHVDTSFWTAPSTWIFCNFEFKGFYKKNFKIKLVNSIVSINITYRPTNRGWMFFFPNVEIISYVRRVATIPNHSVMEDHNSKHV